MRKQARLPSLRADSQILFQISYTLLSFLEGLTVLETCFFFVSLPLLEQHVGGGFKVGRVILETKLNLRVLFVLMPASRGSFGCT